MSEATCVSLSKLAITSALFLPLLAHAAPSACETLAKLALPETVITLAQSVPAGEFTPPEGFRPGAGDPPASALVAAAKLLPSFCRVTATLKPTADSDIKVEIWMPTANWNRKYEAVGNGGWAGSSVIQPWPRRYRVGTPPVPPTPATPAQAAVSPWGTLKN